MSGSLILSAKLEAGTLEEHAQALAQVRNGLPKAMARAVNRTGQLLRNQMVDEVRRVLPLKAGTVRGATGIRLATVADPTGKVWLQGRPIALSWFKPVPGTNFPYTRRGWYQRPPVGVAVMLDLRQGASGFAVHQVIPGSFIVDRKKAWPSSSNRTGMPYEVVKRTGRFYLDQETGKRREAFGILHGPSPAEVLDRPTLERLEVEARKRLAERLHHEAYVILEGIERKAKYLRKENGA